jgi:hypothetical protein
MSDKAINWMLKIGFGLALLLLGGGAWYYTMGRKPHVLISAPVKAGEASAVVRALGPNETLLLVGTKATLYDYTTKQARWSVNLSAAAPAPAATPAPKVAATPVPTPASAPQEKSDPLLAARVKKRFAKLEKWAGELSEKRGKLKTTLQIEGFNVEAAKYHAELMAAREEAAPLNRSATAAAPASAPVRDLDDLEEHERSAPARVEIAVLGGSVWIAQGRRLTALDRADGHVLQSVTLSGNVREFSRGAEEVFVVASVGPGREVQVMRLTSGKDAPQTFALTLPPEPIAEEWHEGSPQKPPTPEQRILFGSNRGALLQLDVRLVERKLTERQTMPGEAGSDLEAADKKTTGGFGSDALVFAQALSRESERDATGGKEIIDESTYEVSLRRPFAPAVSAATVQVHGAVQLISTPTLDLIAAGKELVAFDRANKKLWQTQLAQPIAPIHRSPWGGEDEAAQPCLEAGDRLYFFDTTYVTAFALQTGQPLWRLPLKNIHKIQLDDAGRLYVATQAVELGAVSQLYQLEAKTGRVLWKIEKYDDCFVSGKDLYVTRETRNSEDAVNSVFDRSKTPQCRWKLYKLNTRNGEPQWEWFQTRRPARVEADHKRVALLFADELQVLTSIAL